MPLAALSMHQAARWTSRNPTSPAIGQPAVQGVLSAFDGIARGGGLYLLDTTARIDHGSVDSNSISGGSARGAGIAILQNTSPAVNSLLITHSTIAVNSAVSTSGAAYGGALYQEGDTAIIRNTTVADNRADTGGGLFQDSGTTVVTLSTFLNNTAETNGGAVAVDSPGFLSHALDLINVTISGNSAGAKGGGLYVTGAPLAPEATVVNLYNTVVTDNTNGGVYLVEDHTVPALASGNTIIGEQASGADCAADGTVSFTSSGGISRAAPVAPSRQPLISNRWRTWV
jgi:predicted outer membrane repeat protein